MKYRKKLSKLKNDKKLKRVFKTLNKIREETPTDNMDLTTINQMQYTAALLITNKITPPKPTPNRKQRGRPPAWQTKTPETNRLTKRRHIHYQWLHQWKHHQQDKEETQDPPQETQDNSRWAAHSLKEDLKQALQTKAQSLRRYTKRSEQYKQNKMFREDAKRVYRALGKKTIQIEKPPDMGEVKKFWQNILE